jgi:hypothetical protein
MHLSLGHQFVVGKIQQSSWCCQSFRAWCQAPRSACCLLHFYSHDNFDCWSIRAIVIVSEKAGPVFCSNPLAKSRVTHCSFEKGRHCVSVTEVSVLTHHRILTPPIVRAMPDPSQVWRIDSFQRFFVPNVQALASSKSRTSGTLAISGAGASFVRTYT